MVAAQVGVLSVEVRQNVCHGCGMQSAWDIRGEGLNGAAVLRIGEVALGALVCNGD